MVTVKAALGDDIRRLTTGEEISFAELHLRLCAAFGATGLVLRYRDNENDLVTFTSDSELREALTSAGDGLLRVNVEHSDDNVPTVNITNPVPPLAGTAVGGAAAATAAAAVGSAADQEADMILDHAFESVSWLALGWLVFHAIPLWVLAIGGVILHKQIKARPYLKDKIIRFLRTRRIGAAL